MMGVFESKPQAPLILGLQSNFQQILQDPWTVITFSPMSHCKTLHLVAWLMYSTPWVCNHRLSKGACSHLCCCYLLLLSSCCQMPKAWSIPIRPVALFWCWGKNHQTLSCKTLLASATPFTIIQSRPQPTPSTLWFSPTCPGS